MKQDRESKLLEWFIGGEAQIGKLTEEDIFILLKELGVSGDAAKIIAEDVNTILLFSEQPHCRTTYLNALNYGFTQLAKRAPLIAQEASEKRGGRVALRELPEVVARGHGTVCRASSGRGVGGDRSHVYIWFKPLPMSPCNEYQWYQFGQVNLHVDRQNETDDVRGFSFETSGGAKMKMGEWRADYIQESLDRVNAARQASGKSDLPEFTPPNLRRSRLTTKKPKGKAYIGPSVPGHRGQGVVDAPNLCYRGPNPTTRTASTLDRAANKFIRKQKQSAQSQPAAGSTVIAIVTHFRSYLLCVDAAVSCIGYVEWTYTTTATFNFTWERSDSDVLGNGEKWYQGKTRSRGTCTYALTVGEFKPC